jgi:large subunit ribosomal protein L9
MKVILQKDIINLGDAGDIKVVADGYARNFLLPNKLVILANDKSSKAINHQKRLIKIKKDKRQKDSQKVSDGLANLKLEFTMQSSEEGKLFGSITSTNISKKLKEEGFVIDKKKIQLETPIKQEGEFDVSIKLAEGLTATVKVNVVKDTVKEEVKEEEIKEEVKEEIEE